MTAPRCYWDGPRPCSHDRGAPLPRVRPLTNWMGSHDCIQRVGLAWDGSPLEESRVRLSAVKRERDQRWYAAHRGPDITITARHQRSAS